MRSAVLRAETNPEDSLLKFFIILGNVSGIALFLVPWLTIFKIINKRATENYSCIPYIITLIECLVSVFYDMPFVSQSPPSNVVSPLNYVGVFLHVTYIIIFLCFAPPEEKNKIKKILYWIIGIFCIIVVVSVSAYREDEHKKQLLCGIIAVVSCSVTYAAPLTIVWTVQETKSLECMPLYLSLCVFLNATIWCTCGFKQRDPFIYIPNIIGCVLGVGQLIFYACYSYYGGRNNINHDLPESEQRNDKRQEEIPL